LKKTGKIRDIYMDIHLNRESDRIVQMAIEENMERLIIGLLAFSHELWAKAYP